MKVAAYLCYHDGEHSDLSLQEQEFRILDYAAKNELEIMDWYKDDPIGILKSAPQRGNTTSQCGIVSLLDDLASSQWVYVLVDHPDRLARTDVNFNPVFQLERFNKIVIPVNDNIEIPKRQVTTRKKKRSRKRQMSITERLTEGRRQSAAKGIFQGPTPFGYKRVHGDLILRKHETEAPILNMIFKKYLQLRSMKRVIEFLQDGNYPSKRGKPWSRAALSWILKNTTYLGHVHWGPVRVKGKHPPLVSPIIFNKVQVLIEKNRKRPTREELLARQESA